MTELFYKRWIFPLGLFFLFSLIIIAIPQNQKAQMLLPIVYLLILLAVISFHMYSGLSSLEKLINENFPDHKVAMKTLFWDLFSSEFKEVYNEGEIHTLRKRVINLYSNLFFSVLLFAGLIVLSVKV